LRGTVSTGGFDGVIEVTEEEISEVGAFSEFAALICMNAAAIGMAMLCQESPDNDNGRVFGGSKEDPSVA
jgi:hypothetical protein